MQLAASSQVTPAVFAPCSLQDTLLYGAQLLPLSTRFNTQKEEDE